MIGNRAMGERSTAYAAIAVGIGSQHRVQESAQAVGFYLAECWRPIAARLSEFITLRDDLAGMLTGARVQWGLVEETIRRLKAIPLELAWREGFENVVTTEGKNAALTHFLKGSTYTASQTLGLIEDTGYSAVAAGNTAANITAAGGGSPANGWNEAPSATCASRGTPSFGTAGSGSLATSASVSFSIIATDTIKGAFLMCRSTAGTAPSTTVGNTSGALYSAGLFTGGDRAVANGDTLNVSYTASL